MFWCLTRLCRSFANFLYTDQTYYSCKLKRLGTGTDALTWTTTIPPHTFLCETVSKTYLGETVSKTKVWPANTAYIRESEDDRIDRLDQRPVCPWIWIGCGETDYTDQLTEYVVYGNWITLEFLNELFPEDEWSYVCSKTLEKKEFPAGGIHIK